ncbi:MAG TPA: SPOR domain-containing protein [Flavobacteriales bacterium]|nr:SPOR domain-containing protein [Flavobacteriales bacterium]
MRKDYFDEIFKSSKTVIIPGLGSFTRSESDGKISFNPYLKFNDGFLAGFIAKKQGVSMDEAGKSIAESVDKINEALASKGEALVLGLGVLRKSADGKITFIIDQLTETKVTDAPKKEAPPVSKAPEKPIEEKKPVVEPPKVSVSEKPKEEPKKEPVVEKPVPKEEPKKQPVVEKPVVQDEKKTDIKVTAPELTTVDDTKNKKEVKKEKETPVKEPKAPKPPKEKKERKKRRVPIWFIVFILLAAGGGTFTYLKWDMVKGWLGIDKSHDNTVHENIAHNKEKIKEEKITPPVDTIAAEETTTVTEETASEEVKEKTVKETPSVKVTPPVKELPVVNTPTGTFHVICGNFQSQENANKMVEKLNAEGNQGMNLGLRGGFYMVSAGSFSTMEEANAKRQAISAAHPKAYIYNGR